MTTNQEKVDALIRSFVRTEQNQGWTSSTRKKNLITKKEKQLDTLTRLLTNKVTDRERRQDTCVAIFLKNDGHLLIASNLEEPKYAKSYLEDLKIFIEASSKASYDKTYKKLVKRAVEQTFSFVVANKRREKSGLVLEKLDEFKSMIGNKNNLEVIQGKLKEVFQEFQDKNVEGWHWDYLLPLNDTNEICNDIIDEVFDEKITKAIRGGKICYIKDKLNMHAEMKILNKLYNKRTQSFTEVGYIGITKLCCSPCQIMVELVNSKMLFEIFRCCGSHGSTYLGWIIPDFYQKEFIESLGRSKKWESSSGIPWMPSRSLYGDFERDWVSIHQNFGNQTIKNSWSKHFSWSEAKSLFELLALSPEEDLEFVLWMRKEKKLNSSEVRGRLAKLKANYQNTKLCQNFQSQVQISPKYNN